MDLDIEKILQLLLVAFGNDLVVLNNIKEVVPGNETVFLPMLVLNVEDLDDRLFRVAVLSPEVFKDGEGPVIFITDSLIGRDVLNHLLKFTV